jgi:outer membrane protein assembly factor BamB
MPGGPMDSPWPMYCHDTRHTGRSPYITLNSYDIIWCYPTLGSTSSPAIDSDGVIYLGSQDFQAINPNGTLKWSYSLSGWTESCPAIDENGIIYLGTIFGDPSYLYAFYPNGDLKWKYSVGGVYNIYSSPAIGNDGTIYFGCGGDSPPAGCIKALYPNKTLKWEYATNHVVYSSPAIGDDGIIYCGSHDTFLYALYPNNGTLKWKYKTGGWIRTSPCIADDGTIYVVSLDNYLHAVNPDGTMKWKTNMGEGGTSPTIGQDGTIYAGYTKLHAINPINGSIKWLYDVSGTIRGGTPCNSVDGTIYIGTSDGGKLIAINPNGTLKWQQPIGICESAPAIGSNGIIYIGSNNDYLFAFGELDPNAPTETMINGQTIGTTGDEYEYTFKSTSPVGRGLYYYINWGDGGKKDWFGPFSSGEEATASHTWTNQGTYTIKARAKDTENLWGPWGELTVTMPRDKPIQNPILNWLHSHPNMFPIIRQLLGL